MCPHSSSSQCPRSLEVCSSHQKMQEDIVDREQYAVLLGAPGGVHVINYGAHPVISTQRSPY